MSHSIVGDKYSLNCVDCAFTRTKNLQKFNTIEMFFYVDTKSYFVIEYSFHSIDFEFWEGVIEAHKENVDDFIMTDSNDFIINGEYTNSDEYHIVKLKSKSFNLYRNINLIFFLSDDEGWDNMDEMVRKNSWPR